MLAMPQVGQIVLLFAGYLIGLAAIRLWFSPDWRHPGKKDKQEKRDDTPPEFRPRAKSPRSGVPRRPE